MVNGSFVKLGDHLLVRRADVRYVEKMSTSGTFISLQDGKGLKCNLSVDEVLTALTVMELPPPPQCGSAEQPGGYPLPKKPMPEGVEKALFPARFNEDGTRKNPND